MEENEINKQEDMKELKQDEQKKKFVPSYQNKSNNSTPSGARIDIKKKNTKIRKASKIWMIIAIIIILALGFGIYKLVDYNTYKKYNEYNDKMKVYGFERMYDNKNCNVTDKVTKSEAMKMIVSSVLNIYDITRYFDVENPTYENERWVKYAQEREWLTFEINEENQDKKATLMECLQVLSKIKTDYIVADLDVDKVPNYSDFEKYTNEEQIVLKDMVYNGIIDDDISKLNAYKTIRKGQLNSIIIRFVEKYNLITLDNLKLNINAEKLPYNADEYPYILASVNKEIYQKRFYIQDAEKAILPVEFYADNKESYSKIKYLVKSYVNTIINVDYGTISLDSFKRSLSNSMYYMPSDSTIQKYIDYVKSNHISIIGSSQVVYPAIYFDGQNIRARVYLTYLVQSADTYKNMIFGDLYSGKDYEYKSDGDMYIDITFDKLDNGVLKIVASPIQEWSIGEINISK